MPKFIRRGLEAVLSMIDRIAGAALPQPKLVPVRVVAGKARR